MFYTLGSEVYTTETYTKIADAVNDETAKMIVDILNARTGDTTCSDCGCKSESNSTCTNCGVLDTPK